MNSHAVFESYARAGLTVTFRYIKHLEISEGIAGCIFKAIDFFFLKKKRHATHLVDSS